MCENYDRSGLRVTDDDNGILDSLDFARRLFGVDEHGIPEDIPDPEPVALLFGELQEDEEELRAALHNMPPLGANNDSDYRLVYLDLRRALIDVITDLHRLNSMVEIFLQAAVRGPEGPS